MMRADIASEDGDIQQAIAILEDVLRRHKYAAEDGIGIHFALGDYYDQAGEFGRAFAHFETGNRNRRAAFFGSREQNLAEFYRPTHLQDFVCSRHLPIDSQCNFAPCQSDSHLHHRDAAERNLAN